MTDKAVDIDNRLLPELKRNIDATPTGDPFIVTEFGKPFTKGGFYNRMKEWCEKAGLKNCPPHGLRKASAVRLAELGASDHAIMAHNGWRTLKEVQRYTKGVRRRLMADSASDLLEADIQRTNVSNRK